MGNQAVAKRFKTARIVECSNMLIVHVYGLSDSDGHKLKNSNSQQN